MILVCIEWSMHKERILRRGNWSISCEGQFSSKFVQNDQISIRNTREIHKISQNSKNKHFEVKSLTDWSFLWTLTDSDSDSDSDSIPIFSSHFSVHLHIVSLHGAPGSHLVIVSQQFDDICILWYPAVDISDAICNKTCKSIHDFSLTFGGRISQKDIYDWCLLS